MTRPAAHRPARNGILDVLSALLRDRDDLSLVLITHDLDLARLADRIAVLEGGEVVEQGPAHAVLTAPRHPFTVSLVERAARLEVGAGADGPVPEPVDRRPAPSGHELPVVITRFPQGS